MILASEEADDSSRQWFHTRGLIKFGRPDISVHRVSEDLCAGVQDLCNRYIDTLAFGGVVSDGQKVRMKALPDNWKCRIEGGFDDPDFNNRHIEIGPATPSLRAGSKGRSKRS